MTIWSSIKNLFRDNTVVETTSQRQLTQEFDTYIRRAFEHYLISHILENPDKVLKNKAGTFTQKVELYDEMKRLYPEISAHLQTRKLAVVGHEWIIEPNDAPDEIVEFCKKAIQQIDNLHEDLLDCLTAIERGFSTTEIIWKEKGGRWWPAELKGRDQGDYVFDVENNLRLLTRSAPSEGEVVPPNKYIIHTHSRLRENPYGQSVLQDLYWPYYFWKNASNFWAMYVERFGMPSTIGSSERSVIDTATASTFEAFLKSLQANSWAVLPKGFTVEYKEPAGARDQFSPFMGYWDAKVRLVILGQEMTSYQAAQGNLGTTKIGNEVRQEIVIADAKELSYAFTNYLIRYIVTLNFPYDGLLPKFRIAADPPKDLDVKSQVDERISRIGFSLGKKYIEETYGVRGPEDETDVIERPVALAPSFGFDEPDNRDKLARIAVMRGGNLFNPWSEAIKKKSNG